MNWDSEYWKLSSTVTMMLSAGSPSPSESSSSQDDDSKKDIVKGSSNAAKGSSVSENSGRPVPSSSGHHSGRKSLVEDLPLPKLYRKFSPRSQLSILFHRSTHVLVTNYFV